MQFINKHIHGHQEVGHIDLLQKFSYIEVPEGDAQRVMRALDGTAYKGREVRCNDADESGHGRSARGSRTGADKGDRSYGKGARGKGRQSTKTHDDDSRHGRDDWKQLMADSRNIKLRGEVPDFSEEGWARRRPKKK